MADVLARRLPDRGLPDAVELVARAHPRRLHLGQCGERGRGADADARLVDRVEARGDAVVDLVHSVKEQVNDRAAALEEREDMPRAVHGASHAIALGARPAVIEAAHGVESGDLVGERGPVAHPRVRDGGDDELGNGARAVGDARQGRQGGVRGPHRGPWLDRPTSFASPILARSFVKE